MADLWQRRPQFLNNPARTNFNMSLLKHFPLAHERNVEFRIEAFNVFNHTQFRIYDPSHPGNTGNNVVNCYGDVTTGYSAGALPVQPTAWQATPFCIRLMRTIRASCNLA